MGLDAERVDRGARHATRTPTRSRPTSARRRRLGATGVPFFVVDRTYGVSGAQPAEAFTQVLERSWAETHPTLEHVGHTDGDVCGPDGCPI